MSDHREDHEALARAICAIQDDERGHGASLAMADLRLLLSGYESALAASARVLPPSLTDFLG